MAERRNHGRPSRFVRAGPVLAAAGTGVLAGVLSVACDPAPGPAPEMSIEDVLGIRHPTGPVWSADGSTITFGWDRNGRVDLYSVEPGSGEPPRRLTRWGDSYDEVGGLFEDPDGEFLYFTRNGVLHRMNPDLPGTLETVFGEGNGESGFAPSPDRTRIAFRRGGDLYLRSLADGVESRLTRTPDLDEGGAVWSPDGAHLAYAVSTREAVDETHDISGGKLVFRRFSGTPPDLWTVAASGAGTPRPLASGPGFESNPRWLDGSRVVFQRVSADYRTRTVLVGDIRTGTERPIHETTDPKWWSLTFLGAEPRPSPDGRWVALVEDSSGWDRLIVVDPGTGAEHALSEPGEEVRRYAWSPDGRFLAWDANRGHPGQRHLFVLDAREMDPPAPRRITTGRGTNTQPAARTGFRLSSEHGGFSPDGSRLVFQRTGPRDPPDLHVIPTAGAGEPERLTNSLPETLSPGDFVAGEMIRFPARDGREVPGYLFVPEGLDRSARHPAIVWVHGDGIAQNYDGWHVRRDYAVYHSFHQVLIRAGYVVIMPDYRGSVGYGREWRQEPYRDVGGGDYQDVAAAGEYLAGLDFVDSERIGIWGLSYGGFMTMQALTLDPTLFAAGVNVAGVGDYRLWFRDPGGRWVVSRMGTPEENPDVYDLAAPADRVDRMERPLLMLHGTSDVNVPYFESVHLADRLLRAGKDFEFATYPGEFHYFHREHVLRDAWRRVRRFFDRHLRAGS